MPLLVRAFHLQPESGFHLGEHGIGLEASADFLHSDTLFGALCFAWAEARGASDLPSLLAECQRGEGRFYLSSAFPYAGPVRFFPRPLLPWPVETEAADRLREVRWVSEGIFRAWVAGQDLTAEVTAGTVTPDGLWLTRAERLQLPPRPPGGSFWTTATVPRVTVDRQTNRSTVYAVGRVVFAPGCGLFCLAAAPDGDRLTFLGEALERLGERGLGGERSVGYGRFRVVAVEDWPPPAGSGPLAVTLSLYHPTLADLTDGVLGPGARYRLLRRGGWISSPAWRRRRARTVQMVAEGSVLVHPPGARWPGDLVEVTPPLALATGPAHPVYRYGIAFLVGLADRWRSEGGEEP